MTSPGNERYHADMRQSAGLLLTFSALVTMYSLTGCVSGIAGPNTPDSGKPLFDLIASLCLFVVGLTGVVQAYLVLVQDRGWKMFSMAAIAFTQLAWLPFVGDLVGVGRAATEDPSEFSFISNALYSPSQSDIRLIGSMGIFSIMGYAASLVGALAFMQFNIYSFQAKETTKYNAAYFKGRLLYYSFLAFLAGFAQFAMGIQLLKVAGNGPLPVPIVVGPMVITFPGISVFLGLFQLIVGTIGMLRRFDIGKELICSNIFQDACATLWVCMLVLQILVQVGYPQDSAFNAMGPTLGCLYFALPFMPTYLDHKANTVPETIDAEYYGEASEMGEEKEEKEEGGLLASEDKEEGGEEPKTEQAV